MADARGEYWYFEPGTDASKITVPELRSILLKHGVNYKSSAKKPELVSLFNDVVAPQAAQVQRAHARTKRSTRGITDVPSGSASTVTTEDSEEETLLAPPPGSTTRSTRRTTRASTVESERPPTRAKTPSRAVPAKHSRGTEAEPDERPAVRRVRKSVAPAIKEPSPEPEAWHRGDVASPFTQDNPFQSGSSPAAPETATRDRRRRTTGFEQKERRKSEANRRRTLQPNTEQLDEGVVVPTRDNFDPDIKQEDQDITEEFTPEEQLELVRDRARAGEVDILPPRRRRNGAKATGTLKAMSGTLLLTAAAVFGGAWRQEKIAVGFCGVGRYPTGLAGLEVPEWANNILPTCEPCPPHARCYRDLKLDCDTDFVKKAHPLSLNGLVPIPPTCEPDSTKTRNINNVAQKGVDILRERRAQYECGEPDQQGNPVESPEVSEADLQRLMGSRKRKSMTEQELNDLFDRALPEMKLRDEIIESTDATTGQRKLASSSLAKLPLVCSLRRSVQQSIRQYFLQIIGIVLFVITTWYGKYSFTYRRAMEARAKQLASDVFDRLANHAALSIQEPGVYPDKGISMTQLRDDVLRNEFSSSRRQKLWERVQKKVEFNSNIRAAVRTTTSGDVARMWEWTGPIKLLEDGRSSGKRQSGRFSFGMDSSPPAAANDMQEVQKWDEGRPIY